MEKIEIGGIMQSDGRALLKIMSVPDHAGVAGIVFKAMGENGINVELLVESFDIDDCGNFVVVIDQKDMGRTLDVMDKLKTVIDARALSYISDVAVITVFAPHLREKPRIHGMMFSSMASVGISSLAISTSLSSVSCVIEGRHLNATIQALTDVFYVPGQIKERPKDY